MSKRILPILFLIAGVTFRAFAQNAEPTIPRTCATMEQDSINKLRYPRRVSLDEMERDIQLKMAEIRTRKNTSGRTGLITIPIIVHVVHNGEAVGTGLNISQAQVQAQIAVLNEDYRKKAGTPGFNTSPVGADIEMEFCLSPVDENGVAMTEPGIDRYNGGKASWSKDDIEGSLKSVTSWNPNLFYNVWTLKFGGTDSNLLGYAQFPDNSGLTGLNETGGPASTDGVVIQFSSFGSADKGTFPVMQAPYNKGRTLSHETGHFFGLRHIWGDGNCADDFVSDTPTQQGPSSGCPTGRFSCGTTNMVENYMDYSNDACMNIFTEGQKTRMRAVMELSPRRASLINANLCSPITAEKPTANFSSDKQLVLLGGKVNFTDLSTNFPNAWTWTFAGGDPGTSTDRNPVIKYTTAGIYTVTLIAKNSLGSDTLKQVDYITVSSEGLCGTTNNFLPSYTPSLLSLSDYGPYTGYLTGHNSLLSPAISEFFPNALGYNFISGVKIQFGQAHAATDDATITIVVWNARGPQHAPGSVIEQKVVLLKQIVDDVANNRPTNIVFDRVTPVFSRPYQVGILLDYSTGNSVAIQSSAEGQSSNATSWIQNQAGTWSTYAIAFGANIAMNIAPAVGMDPSVQVSASKLLIYPGEEVILNGQGASIFVWNADDGSVTNVAGPQLIVHPIATTTYITAGSGLTLCTKSATTTIYVRNDVTGLEPAPVISGISLFPNPGTDQLNVVLENTFRGEVIVKLLSAVGSEMASEVIQKTEDKLVKTFATGTLQPGVYLVALKLGDRLVTKKWVKY
jgi:PKD repeat protein